MKTQMLDMPPLHPSVVKGAIALPAASRTLASQRCDGISSRRDSFPTVGSSSATTGDPGNIVLASSTAPASLWRHLMELITFRVESKAAAKRQNQPLDCTKPFSLIDDLSRQVGFVGDQPSNPQAGHV